MPGAIPKYDTECTTGDQYLAGSQQVSATIRDQTGNWRKNSSRKPISTRNEKKRPTDRCRA